mmetsp:Transcript_40804/g.107812  ORF Transcript_40804/g.107812 Transcript_40804/m.107812 type:complete len:241 (+) Transcript_40804:1096-1818(+)
MGDRGRNLTPRAMRPRCVLLVWECSPHRRPPAQCPSRARCRRRRASFHSVDGSRWARCPCRCPRRCTSCPVGAPTAPSAPWPTMPLSHPTPEPTSAAARSEPQPSPSVDPVASARIALRSSRRRRHQSRCPSTAHRPRSSALLRRQRQPWPPSHPSACSRLPHRHLRQGRATILVRRLHSRRPSPPPLRRRPSLAARPWRRRARPRTRLSVPKAHMVAHAPTLTLALTHSPVAPHTLAVL